MSEEKNCYNCHFLCEKRPLKHRKILKPERDVLIENMYDYEHPNLKNGEKNVIKCFYDVWRTGHFQKNYNEDNNGQEKLKEILTLPREGKNECFFMPLNKNMKLEVAKVLEERKYNQREAEKDRNESKKRSIKSVIISIIAIIASLIIGIINSKYFEISDQYSFLIIIIFGIILLPLVIFWVFKD